VVLYSPLKDCKSSKCKTWNFRKFWLQVHPEELTHWWITPVTLAKVLAQEGVDKRTLVHLFMAFNLELNKSDYSQPGSDFERFEGAIAPMRQD